MATAAPVRHAASASSQRHHPYASSSSSGSTSKDARKAQAASARSSTGKDESNNNALPSGSRLPPSPPRSRRDGSEETPAVGLNVAFGSSGGSKWWDEELPAPPASLTAILDSFRKSGEGDRELLLSILGAKKAEEERLTALITTRLTILQARLSLHSAAAAAAASSTYAPSSGMPSPMPPMHQHLAVPSGLHGNGNGASAISSPRLGPSPTTSPHQLPPFAMPSSGPMQPSRSNSPPPHQHQHHHHHIHHRHNLPSLSLPGDRTPSLTSRGSDASSAGAVSPSSENGRYLNPNPLDEPRALKAGGNPDLERYRAAVHTSPNASAPTFWRRSPERDERERDNVSLPPIRPRATSGATKPVTGAGEDAEMTSLSPKSAEARPFNGIDLLLDAGRRAVM